MPSSPAEPGAGDTPPLHARPCYLRMLALPTVITTVIILAAVHALTAPTSLPLTADRAGGRQAPAPPPSTASATAAGMPPATGPAAPAPTGQTGSPQPSPSPVQAPPAVTSAGDGPPPGAYHLRSLNGGCFDIGYTAGQAPTVAQKPCSSDPPATRFGLEPAGAGGYRMTAVPGRGADAGQPLCVTSAGTGRPVVLAGCQDGRGDQVLSLLRLGGDWYQVGIAGQCLTASGRDARVRACGNSQAQRFSFTPIH